LTGTVVDAIDAAAVASYQKYGFLELPKVPSFPWARFKGLFQLGNDKHL